MLRNLRAISRVFNWSVCNWILVIGDPRDSHVKARFNCLISKCKGLGMSLLIVGLATIDGFIVITCRPSFTKFPSSVLIRLVWLRYSHLKMSKFTKKCMAIRTLPDTAPDEEPTLKTSAFESRYGGQCTLSTQLIKPNYLVIVPPTQHHNFFRSLPPWYISLLILTFLNSFISVKASLINTKLGGFVNFGVLFVTMWRNWCLSHNLQTRT